MSISSLKAQCNSLSPKCISCQFEFAREERHSVEFQKTSLTQILREINFNELRHFDASIHKNGYHVKSVRQENFSNFHTVQKGFCGALQCYLSQGLLIQKEQS